MKGNILALSGGGYRGLYTVRVLQRVEEHIGKPLGDHFDLITGTSIGGIIALGIAAGIPLKEIERIFIEKGGIIFSSPIDKAIQPKYSVLKPITWAVQRLRWVYRNVHAVFRPIHRAEGLKSVLTDLFGEKTLGDLDQAYVAVTAANLSTGTPKMFKTPHHGDLYLDKDLKVVEVALATSAAPSYFPMHEVEGANALFADGALMGNAPGLFGWLEARTRLCVADEEITVLSVGTLAGKPSVSGATNVRKGAWYWLSPGRLRLLTFLMSQQEQLTNYMLGLLLGVERYHLIDYPVSDEAAGDIALDDSSESATRTLLNHADKHFADFLSTEFCKRNLPRTESTNAK